jgi:hypothetical protein
MPEMEPGEIPGHVKASIGEALKRKNKIDREKVFCSFLSKPEETWHYEEPACIAID